MKRAILSCCGDSSHIFLILFTAKYFPSLLQNQSKNLTNTLSICSLAFHASWVDEYMYIQKNTLHAACEQTGSKQLCIQLSFLYFNSRALLDII